MENKVALIGSGNAFFKDEGIGLYAVKYLKENFTFTPSISIVDGGTLGFRLMALLQEHETVIIVNTASDDEKEFGSISVKTCDEFLNGDLIKKTANEVEIAEMLQICSLTQQMAETTLISIVPEDIVAVEVGLSESLQKVWLVYINTILDILRQSGVTIKEHTQITTVEDILYTFANPSIEHNRGF